MKNEVYACENCVFWEPIFDEDGRYSPTGFCRKGAPVPVPQPMKGAAEFRGVWPVTDADDWCGEFKRR